LPFSRRHFWGKSNISEQTNYLQSKFTIIHPQNYKMSPLRDVTLAGLAKSTPKMAA
jgi:hypothetical protein